MNILYTCLKRNIFKRLTAITLFSLVSLLCYGEIPIPWNAGVTISTDTDYCQKDGETYRIKVGGNVTMNGYIKVGNGSNSVTVIVEIADGVTGPVTLKNSSADSFFRVYPKSKLIIRGKDNDHRIILDGGATQSTKKGTTYEMIGTAGTLEMQYVTVQNNQITNISKNYSAIKINPKWMDNQLLGTTTIKNCSFINCSSRLGPVLFTDNEQASTTNVNNTPTSCAITMTDVIIDGCRAESHNDGGFNPASDKDTEAGAAWAGIIRTSGNWVGNLTLTRVEIKNCSTPYCCAGVFWNAMGKAGDVNRRPQLVVDGCKFHHNTAGRSGGAMRIETFCEFTGAQTEINNNTAGIMGGGIHMYGYAASNLGKFDFDYFLTDKLYIHDNTADYGGGIGFQLTSACQLTAGSTFNLHLNGATVSNNRANVKGGGLYFENLSRPDQEYTVNLHLNSGQMNNNKANPNKEDNYDKTLGKTFYDKKDASGNVVSQEDNKSCGGAVFVYNTNINHDPNQAAVLTMNGNKAMRRGGAICVTGTKASANLKAISATGNIAQDGGGLACMSTSGVTKDNYSSITLGNLTLDQCESIGWGGGVFADRGKITINDNATITRSTTGDLGGGIHCRNHSILTINEATISNNTTNTGGGLYAQDLSTIEIGKATFEHNTAHKNGGAIFLVKGGTLNINNQARFTYNTVEEDGGGAICVKVNNDKEEEYIKGTIQNAYFAYNKAYRGGAIEFDGINAGNSLIFTLKNNTMEHNEAKLGGALLINEAQVNYEGGLIRWNKAKYVEGDPGGPKTSFGYFPYYWTYNCYRDRKFSGFGGGIIVSKDGRLSISKTEPFGIYSNEADIAGNDISTVCSQPDKYNDNNKSPMGAECKYYPGTITIPNPKNLNLSEFQVPVPKSAISWMEDYNQEDGAYSLGTNKLKNEPHYRYGQLLESADKRQLLGKIIVDTEAQGLSQYLHLSLGYNFIFVKIIKEGLKEGESAIFNISYKENETYNKYMTIAFTGKAGGGPVERIVALTVGTWRIEETNWSYTYKTSTPSIDITLTADDAIAAKMPTYTFKNEKKANIDQTTPNSEAIKQNNF